MQTGMLLSALICFLISAVGLYYNYQPGSVVFLANSSFLIEYTNHPITWNIFQILFCVVLFGCFWDVLKNLYFWKNKPDQYKQKYLIAGVAIIIYGIIGYFEQQGYILSLVTVLLRITINLSIFIAYLAFSNQEEDGGQA